MGPGAGFSFRETEGCTMTAASFCRRVRTTGAAFVIVLGCAAEIPGQAAAQAITEFPMPTAEGQPFDITAGPDGNLWFTEQSASRIGRITPAGVITEFAAP